MQFTKLIFCGLIISLLAACSSDGLDGGDPAVNPDPDPMDINFTIWTGADLTFTNPDDADPTLEENQDRISDNVWLTRDKEGQIFNIKTESSPDKSTSPVDTEWAKGKTSNISALDFKPFREGLGKPKDLENVDLVLHLVTDDVYIDVRFESWSEGKDKAGFSYTRSTKN